MRLFLQPYEIHPFLYPRCYSLSILVMGLCTDGYLIPPYSMKHLLTGSIATLGFAIVVRTLIWLDVFTKSASSAETILFFLILVGSYTAVSAWNDLTS